uniref:Odorant-binding protein 14 n=1 Tax=Tropidothorax elegans TaxID=2233830 RepID=A0A2Z5EM68_9HEMI|nr:odorant-binding protein 14 [Tropidothorax elegans]
MNGHIFSAVLLAAVFVAAYAGEDKMNEKIQKAFNNCKEKHNPPEGDLDMMKKKDLEFKYSKEAKCMIACMLEEGKILKDGKYNKENALVMSDVLHKDDADEAAKARQVVETCYKEHPEVGSDQCEYAYQLAICGGHEAKKLGMKDTPDFFNP